MKSIQAHVSYLYKQAVKQYRYKKSHTYKLIKKALNQVCTTAQHFIRNSTGLIFSLSIMLITLIATNVTMLNS